MCFYYGSLTRKSQHTGVYHSLFVHIFEFKHCTQTFCHQESVTLLTPTHLHSRHSSTAASQPLGNAAQGTTVIWVAEAMWLLGESLWECIGKISGRAFPVIC